MKSELQTELAEVCQSLSQSRVTSRVRKDESDPYKSLP
jgi:hypothetical protein